MSISAAGPDPGEGPALDPLDSGGLDASQALELLRSGELEITGRLVDASNATLLCEIRLDCAVADVAAGAGDGAGADPGGDGAGRVTSARCVYKPVRGERALWDFPDGTLAARELAAYEVSEAMDPGIVPPTVMRPGPFGEGMVQLWIDVDTTVDLVELTRSDDPRLRRIALFDAVINNSDRKGGHLLPAPSGRVYGIDHGVTFHTDDKLRTLLWTWRGERLTARECTVLRGLSESLGGDLGERLTPLLTTAELAALQARVERLLARRRFPMPSADWPAIPWPPF
ncbi:conserved hypothetical protein [Parafrankia irregularis]|uniref:PI3K/PI4K catalytic domain-containing protein n=1 Tax=Parafrankia irregularis TaxID=795642 RepID=A0A0S4QV10_9ACTN|nr:MULTISPECIES: SCO1664 family protein [Parafrankia]MBE3201831.1 SCO1664 family protein [Parafrankia sp. CH37]CUU58314.1 conserved hypothetical protein [Parafrankia irregularis]